MPHGARPRLLPGANSGVREQFSSPFAKANPRSRLSSSCIKAYRDCIMMSKYLLQFHFSTITLNYQLPPKRSSAAAVSSDTKTFWGPSIARCSGGCVGRGSNLHLHHFFTGRNLPRSQERLNQRALSADNHLGKSFEPSTLRHFRIFSEPICEQPQLRSRNFALSNSPDEVRHQRLGDAFASNARHRSTAVKARKNLFFQSVCLFRVFGRHHLIC